MSLFQDIRGALQNNLVGVTNIPTIAWEGMPFSPVVGTPFVEPVLFPLASIPKTMGADHLILHEGLFLVTLVYPATGGTGAVEAMADAVKTAYNVSTPLALNSRAVRVRSSQRGGVEMDSDWMRLLVSVSWYTYDTDY